LPPADPAGPPLHAVAPVFPPTVSPTPTKRRRALVPHPVLKDAPAHDDATSLPPAPLPAHDDGTSPSPAPPPAHDDGTSPSLATSPTLPASPGAAPADTPIPVPPPTGGEVHEAGGLPTTQGPPSSVLGADESPSFSEITAIISPAALADAAPAVGGEADLVDGFPPDSAADGKRVSSAGWVGIAAASAAAFVLAIVLIVVALSSGEPDEDPAAFPTAPTTSVTEPSTPTGPSPGQRGATAWSKGREFVSGDYSMIINGIDTGQTELGDDGSWTAANGTFIVFDVVVTYTGDGKGQFPPNMQKLVMADGRAYDADVASLSVLPREPLGTGPLDPNLATPGYLVFDVGTDDVPHALEFKGDILSPTITIPLG
ncbi:MAG: DUF4352 domain-containing protein, partial [Micrococcales bacterium]|nr:DUF4352 domain-containing protein [Micrococcales bacterium]